MSFKYSLVHKLAFDRLSVQPNDLQQIYFDQYMNIYGNHNLARIYFNLDVAFQTNLFIEVKQEIENIVLNGITAAEVRYYPELAHLIQDLTQQFPLRNNKKQKFLQELRNEFRIKQIDPQALWEVEMNTQQENIKLQQLKAKTIKMMSRPRFSNIELKMVQQLQEDRKAQELKIQLEENQKLALHNKRNLLINIQNKAKQKIQHVNSKQSELQMQVDSILQQLESQPKCNDETHQYYYNQSPPTSTPLPNKQTSQLTNNLINDQKLQQQKEQHNLSVRLQELKQLKTTKINNFAKKTAQKQLFVEQNKQYPVLKPKKQIDPEFAVEFTRKQRPSSEQFYNQKLNTRTVINFLPKQKQYKAKEPEKNFKTEQIMLIQQKINQKYALKEQIKITRPGSSLFYNIKEQLEQQFW
ncbi:Hypothetical_protein [Hexamita inflata]|uniref:Hypothetical_protein n=1 Tax=Hexamita inflata TaxID=28002 RepID=A0AA86Q3Z5_9EUKA|nr:Hypothetical protein HINF_LOCUS36732 [Hexamita inflata]